MGRFKPMVTDWAVNLLAGLWGLVEPWVLYHGDPEVARSILATATQTAASVFVLIVTITMIVGQINQRWVIPDDFARRPTPQDSRYYALGSLSVVLPLVCLAFDLYFAALAAVFVVIVAIAAVPSHLKRCLLGRTVDEYLRDCLASDRRNLGRGQDRSDQIQHVYEICLDAVRRGDSARLERSLAVYLSIWTPSAVCDLHVANLAQAIASAGATSVLIRAVCSTCSPFQPPVGSIALHHLVQPAPRAGRRAGRKWLPPDTWRISESARDPADVFHTNPLYGPLKPRAAARFLHELFTVSDQNAANSYDIVRVYGLLLEFSIASRVNLLFAVPLWPPGLLLQHRRDILAAVSSLPLSTKSFLEDAPILDEYRDWNRILNKCAPDPEARARVAAYYEEIVGQAWNALQRGLLQALPARVRATTDPIAYEAGDYAPLSTL